MRIRAIDAPAVGAQVVDLDVIFTELVWGDRGLRIALFRTLGAPLTWYSVLFRADHDESEVVLSPGERVPLRGRLHRTPELTLGKPRSRKHLGQYVQWLIPFRTGNEKFYEPLQTLRLMEASLGGLQLAREALAELADME